MKKHFPLLAALVLSVSSVSAAVDATRVAADARWLVYADLNALRVSAMGKELIALGEKFQLATPGGKVGIDWQKLLATVGSATAYGANISSDPKQIDGALVIQGTADLRKIAEAVLLQANLANPNDVAELTDLPFPAYVLKNSKSAKPAELEVIIAFPSEPVVLVSKSRAQILKAHDVFRGAAPSLAKAPASPLAKFLPASAGAYLFTATTVPAENFFPGDGPQARILKMTNAGSLALGERGPDTFAHAELTASSEQMAEKLMKILQGMTAMLSLAETNDKQLADFLNSAVVNRSGQTVMLDVAYASARLVAMTQSLQQTQPAPETRSTPRPPQMTNGKVLAEWTAERAAAPASGPGPVVWRTMENVELKNGTTVTLGRLTNGGKNIRFEQIEISPAQGAGAPLVFRPEFMKAAGARGAMAQFQFPGADGVYTLKAAYLNDPDGKATYAVSVKDPAPRPASGETPSK